MILEQCEEEEEECSGVAKAVCCYEEWNTNTISNTKTRSHDLLKI